MKPESFAELSARERLALLKLEVERRRQSASVDYRARVRAHLFDKQLEVLDSKQRIIPVVAGRRGGKTETVPSMGIDRCLAHPRSLFPYITLTRSLAKRQLWPRLQALVRKHGIDVRTNESELTMQFRNESTIMLGGCDDVQMIERYRGDRLCGAAVDECGSQNPDILRRLIVDVLQPACADLQAPIMLTGTPGPTLDGYWFEMSGPDSPFHVYRWTMLDNPHIPHARAEMDLVLEMNRWDDTHPTYLREYLCQWVRDDEALVFPWSMEDQLDALPEPDGWRYVLGVDVGQVDATAYVLLAGQRSQPHDYVVESRAASGLLIDQIATDIRRYQERCKPLTVVMDTGGMGKQHAVELQRRFGIAVKPADKREKLSAIRVMRDQIRAHQIKMLAGECNDVLRSEWAVLRWNEDRTEIEDGQIDHAAHAALYAHRELRNYVYEPKPTPLSPLRAEEQRLKLAALKRGKSNQRTEWDR